MTDRKQEAIEILKQYVQPNRSEGFILRDATEIYDRLAPLIDREFPQKRIEDAFCEYGHKVANDPHAKVIQLPSSDEFVADLKRLWEGEQDKPKDYAERRQEYKPMHLDPLRGRFTCRKCGGSREVPHNPLRENLPFKPSVAAYRQMSPYKEVCPDCCGTGEERRSGKERRIEVRKWGDSLRRILADRRK